MARENKICSSPDRKKIDRLLLQGKSIRFISKQVKNISYQSIQRYAKSENPCNGRSPGPIIAIRKAVEEEKVKVVLSGLETLRYSQEDLIRRLEAQPPGKLDGPIVGTNGRLI